MEFRIADTFTESLARLTGDEQKAVKTTAFDLQLNPVNPGMQFHKIEQSKDKNFWSVRVNADIRLIVHKTHSSLLLCYVGHHDKAYDWARRRKLETHPKTGAAQLVEIRETVQEVLIQEYREASKPETVRQLLFGDISDDELLRYGVPAEWLLDVRGATEDSLLTIADHLPSEAAEALLELATGGRPRMPQLMPLRVSPFDHPDAQRRFRVMGNIEELQRALDSPWDKWTIFLHPEQRELVEHDFAGPARVSGSAGTGKTIVALHRAVFLARNHTDSRVLLTTFSETLANALRVRLRRLISNEPRLAERLEVHAINAIGERLYERHFGKPKLATVEIVTKFLIEAAKSSTEKNLSLGLLQSEWEEIVDAWRLDSWESYRDIKRLGRKTRLPESKRKVLWSIFDVVRHRLSKEGLVTIAGMFHRLADQLAERKQSPFDFAVIDESQDVAVSQLRFLAALGANRPNALFFAGDLGQRIFQLPFSWLSLGVDIRGRSQTLRVNYRTSHQIRTQADRLLAPEVADVDGNAEERRGTVSVFNGPPPVVGACESQEAEMKFVADWLSARYQEGVAPHEIGVFVRSDAEIERARAAVSKSGLAFRVLQENLETGGSNVSIGTMHLAKGLEFRAVAVMACDDDIVPLQSRIESVADEADLEEVYNTERHLLYVACTRARDHLLVTGVAPVSEFLEDLVA